MKTFERIGTSLILAGVFAVPALIDSSLAGEKYTTLTTAQILEMAGGVEADIKANYYDPKMHGIDLDKRFNEARAKIAAAKSQDEALLDIAAAVAALNDSHTHFTPPVRPYGVDYGWLMQPFGDTDCYVTGVRPESDAAAKGIKPGDQVTFINGVKLARQDIGNIQFTYNVFPQSGFHLDVLSPDGNARKLVVMSKVVPGQPLVRFGDVENWAENRRKDEGADRSRYYKSKQIYFWKLPDFIIDPHDVDDLLNKTHSYDTVVLDLRGNPGGIVLSAEKFIGGFFDHDIKVGDQKGRITSKPEVAKSRGAKAFSGKLIVLVDSRSASAAEVFARVVQLEKRGIVLGDRSEGAVMEAQRFIRAVELNVKNVSQYGAMITVADLIMTDGKSLENIGVMPDERIVPTPADIAAGRDPALARAATLAGASMTPEEAGKIFPFQWPKQGVPKYE
jgi:C-terminal processing protease CtpA/Prc